MGKSWIAGAAGGLFGGAVMKGFVRLADPNSFGLSARTDARTAHEIWRRAGWEPLTEKTAERIGAGMHYAFAAGAGAGYAAFARCDDGIRLRCGAVFGAALWLIGDEMAVSVSGIEDPRRTRVVSHVSALAAHVLYGVVVEAFREIGLLMGVRERL